MFGIGPKHIRRLCDSPWEGGYGYTPEEVGRMTLDQVFMLLTDSKFLRGSASRRTSKVSTNDLAATAKDGKIQGRDRDGNPIVGRIRGKSLARELMEKKQREEAERKKRGN